MAAKKAVLIATGPWHPEPWAAAVVAADPDRPVHIWPDVPDPALIRYAMVWGSPEGALARLPALEVIFSLGAGVDHLMFQEAVPDVPIVRIVNAALTQRMTEWVVLQVLAHHRRQRVYDRFQRERRWQEVPQPAAAEVRVGIMGLGVLGRDAAAVLVRLGFQVAGWTRRPTQIAGVATYHGSDGLQAFLARSDILACLLPLTSETQGILALPVFEKLARDGARGGRPILINAGRGGLQVEADIVVALERGILGGASLDVFEQEPLARDCPLWGFDNVVITPHCAAWSEPSETTALVMRQIAAYEAGQPLQHLVDRAAMY